MRHMPGVLTTGLLLLAATLSAHHSFAAEFDANQAIGTAVAPPAPPRR